MEGTCRSDFWTSGMRNITGLIKLRNLIFGIGALLLD